MATAPPGLDDRLMLPVHYGRTSQPFADWAWLRAHEPIHWTEPAARQPFWAVTSHAAITEISARPERFSNVSNDTGFPPIDQRPSVIRQADRVRRAIGRRVAARTGRGADRFGSARHLITLDPPEHRQLRHIAARYFSPRSISELDDLARTVAAGVIDDLQAAGPGPVDFVDVVAKRHPLRVLSHMLGIDPSQEALILELTEEFFGGEDPDAQRTGDTAGRDLDTVFFELFDEIIDDRLRSPRDDLATLLAHARFEDGTDLTRGERLGYFLVVFTAGHDTTRHALSGGVKALADNPDQLRRLQDDPPLTRSGVEEIVRFVAPVNYMKRRVVEDTTILGTPVRAGDDLALFYASANRDETVFDDPDRFDVGRNPNRHLGFGWAEHYCLGAHLARLGIDAVLEQLSDRVAVIEPAGEPTWTAATFVHGLKTLPVEVSWRT